MWILQDVFIVIVLKQLQPVLVIFQVGFIIVVFFVFLSVSDLDKLILLIFCVWSLVLVMPLWLSLRFQFVKPCQTSGNDNLWSDTCNPVPPLTMSSQVAKGNNPGAELCTRCAQLNGQLWIIILWISDPSCNFLSRRKTLEKLFGPQF